MSFLTYNSLSISDIDKIYKIIQKFLVKIMNFFPERSILCVEGICLIIKKI